MITSTFPDDAFYAQEGTPTVVRNALQYGKMKEQLLSEPFIFRCDVLDETATMLDPPPLLGTNPGTADIKKAELDCSYKEFKMAVANWTHDIVEAVAELEAQTPVARDLVRGDMKAILQPALVNIRILFKELDCTFVWGRWMAITSAFCGSVVYGTLYNALSTVSVAVCQLVAVVVFYNTWRHYLDNRVVGLELERYENKWGYLEEQADQTNQKALKDDVALALKDKAGNARK